MLLSDGVYRRHLGWLMTSWVTGHTNETMTEVYSYLGLRERNELLLAENAQLRNNYIELERRVKDAIAEAKLPEVGVLLDSTAIASRDNKFVTARIVNLSARTGEVYYIINKGSRDGLRQDMPVMSDRGVLGAILDVSNNYAVVIPIINPKLRLSCTIKTKGHKGTLMAQGHTYDTRLGDVPVHAQVAPGDTILTSGYSFLFPEGLFVGTIKEIDSTRMTGAAGAFANYKVNLGTDFEQLSYVYILLTPTAEEAEELLNRNISGNV